MFASELQVTALAQRLGRFVCRHRLEPSIMGVGLGLGNAGALVTGATRIVVASRSP